MQAENTKEPAGETRASIKPFQIRGRFFTAVALRPNSEADKAFYEALDAQLRETPRFFDNAPLVIDLETAGDVVQSGDLVRLLEQLRSRKLSVFGVQNASTAQAKAAVAAGLIVLPGGRDVPMERVGRNGAQPSPKAKKPSAPTTRVVTDPVRSGQTVLSERGDLVIVGSVSAGAELVASGNIHVYGTLRGRALAGVNGDEAARIFCHSLDAELIAIAGLYRTSEDLGASVHKQRIQAFLKDEKLFVEPLS